MDFARTFYNWRWSFLLLLLLAAMFSSAAAGDRASVHILTMTTYSLVFAGTLLAAQMTPFFRNAGLLLVVLWFGLGVLGSLDKGTVFGPFFTLVTACLIVGCLLVTVSELVRNKDTGLDSILGAVFGYILIAVSWSMLYGQIALDAPGSFKTPSEHISSTEFIYFSLVTISSLGYGDITPTTPIPRLLAGLQAATGTIYIAVFIGRVVGRLND